MCRVQISSILTSDEDMVKIENWERAPEQYNIRRKIKGQTFFEGKMKKPKPSKEKS